MACPGVYKGSPGNGGTCYVYDVIKAVCLEVSYGVDPETTEAYWEYRDGCFKGGEAALYERGVPGATYTFDYVPIEVRADSDPFTVASKQGTLDSDHGTDLSFFGWLSWVAFSLVLIATLVLGLSATALKLFI